MTQIDTELKIKEERALAEQVQKELAEKEEGEKGEVTVAELLDRLNKIRRV